MATVKVLSMDGKDAGTIELKDEIFGIEPNQNAVHEVVKNYLANQRQGTQSAKTRAEVRGGGKKPFRQKGTGRHRQGSTTDPSQIGGGIVLHQSQGSYRYAVPKKVKRLAMLSAFLQRYRIRKSSLSMRSEVRAQRQRKWLQCWRMSRRLKRHSSLLLRKMRMS
jgi:50S ribosomal protein L4